MFISYLWHTILGVIILTVHSNLSAQFFSVLGQDTRANAFYQACNPTQKRAILQQANMLSSEQALHAFIAHLPSAAL